MILVENDKGKKKILDVTKYYICNLFIENKIIKL